MQLKGNIKFGPSPTDLTDFDDEIAALTLTFDVATQTRRATFGNPKTSERFGTESASMAVDFDYDESMPLGLQRLVLDSRLHQRDTYTGREKGELWFEGTFRDGPPDAILNPKWGGWVLPTSIDVGGTVGSNKEQNKTWPCRDVVEMTATSS